MFIHLNNHRQPIINIRSVYNSSKDVGVGLRRSKELAFVGGFLQISHQIWTKFTGGASLSSNLGEGCHLTL